MATKGARVKNKTRTFADSLAVVIPTLNAADNLPRSLASLVDGPAGEIVVVDGGSTDGTPALATAAGARVIAASRGRGIQLASGTEAARADWLLLLHADTEIAAGWGEAVRRHMAEHPGQAAYFRFRLASRDPRARLLESLVAWRCRLLALPYGDQGLLIPRALLESVGGIRPLPLMEDVDLIRRLGRRRLCALDVAATTSAARWERDGWLRRSARNLACLALWFAGVPPERIARLYAAG